MRTVWMPFSCHSSTAFCASLPPASRSRSSAIPSTGPAARAGAAKTKRTASTARTRRICVTQTRLLPPELRCNQGMATTDVSEREARQVAEAAREQDWKLPSFGKELFLGNFRLDLIHPQPKLDAA